MGEIEKRVDGHDKTLYGDNGTEGLVKKSIEHKMKIEALEKKDEEMCEHLQSLSTSYAALSKSQLEQDLTTRIKIAQEEKNSKAKIARFEMYKMAIQWASLILIVLSVVINLKDIIIWIRSL